MSDDAPALVPAKTRRASDNKIMQQYQQKLRTPEYVVNLARSCSVKAIKALSDILDDSSQPVVARIRSAEILLDRAYGKAPQAMVVATTNDAAKSGIHAIPILERIAQLRQARETPVAATTDLEASEIREVPLPGDQDISESTADAPLDCPDLTPENSPI